MAIIIAGVSNIKLLPAGDSQVTVGHKSSYLYSFVRDLNVFQLYINRFTENLERSTFQLIEIY